MSKVFDAASAVIETRARQLAEARLQRLGCAISGAVRSIPMPENWVTDEDRFIQIAITVFSALYQKFEDTEKVGREYSSLTTEDIISGLAEMELDGILDKVLEAK